MEAMSAGRTPEWTVADRLRKARESAGLEQQELATMIDCSRQTVGNYENNNWDRTRRRATLRLWAWACGVDPAWIDPSLNGPPPFGGGSVMQESLSACINIEDFRHKPLGFCERPAA